MITKHFYIVVGTIVLALSADMAVRAGAKSSPSKIYITAGGACVQLTVATPSSNTFTTGGSGSQTAINNATTSTSGRLWGTNTCAAGAKPIHFHG